MKKNDVKNCPKCESCPQDTKQIDTEDKIYNFLNSAEKIAVKLAQINQILKKSAKKKKKKNKKLGKVDKKTGTLILKVQKRQKPAKALKRYKSKPNKTK